MSYFFTKTEDRKAGEILSGGLVPVRRGRIQGKGVGG
jgi:hypothetical protein